VRLARAEERLTIAIYAPNAAFESGDARYGFASRLASHFSAAGLAAEPKAFARAADFEAAIKKGQVDLAVVDGVYLAERGVPFQVLATATAGGETSARWFLYADAQSTLLELGGKRLAQVGTGGRDAAFVDNALLEGELPRLFAERQSTPDVASAVAAVVLHKADATFAPEAVGKNLHRVFDAGRVPNPALVVVRPQLPHDLIDRARATALGQSVTGSAYEGWKPAVDGYRALSTRLQPRTRRPVMAEPAAQSIDPMEALVLPPLPTAEPDLRGQFFTP
jgi:hypothetical protein